MMEVLEFVALALCESEVINKRVPTGERKYVYKRAREREMWVSLPKNLVSMRDAEKTTPDNAVTTVFGF
jgi:hypothetical protein